MRLDYFSIEKNFYGFVWSFHRGSFVFLSVSSYLMKRQTNLLLAVASGILLWASWPMSPLTFLIFVAWIPLLWLESKITSRKKFFGFVYLTMLIWNLSTTWWIWNASIPGALSAFLANSLIMCLPWIGYRSAKKRLGQPLGYISLIVFWMTFEYIHLQDWGLSWPWLTLGNVFATHPEWVKWYQFTGTSGGSLWTLIVNVMLFRYVKQTFIQGERNYKLLGGSVLLLLFPIILSIMTPAFKSAPGSDMNVVVVQPNIDPYEKVSTGTFEEQLQRLIRTSETAVDDNTALLVWPETALYMQNRIEEASMKENYFLNPLWGFLKQHPNLSLFTGIESFQQMDSATKYSQEYDGYFYETYNGSVLLDSTGPQAFYHKSMLVPGVETLPWFLKFIDKWFDKFGGTTAGYAKQDVRTVLQEKHGYKIAPAICYESIYGEFMSRYIRNGANLVCIITNDGWWQNTPGHKQHMHYARLRAIESGTWIARSANTGISCFIDPSGNVISPQPYNTKAAIKYNIPASPARSTFFVRNGDLLSRLAVVLSIVLVVGILAIRIRNMIHARRNKYEKGT